MNILGKMLDLLPGAYSKKDEYNARNGLALETNIGRLLSLVAWGFGLIEKNSSMVRLWTDIDRAKGAVLDRYGNNFGVKRGGADDIFYRLMIRTKILSQISGGDIDTIISAVASLYNIDPVYVNLREVFPAKLEITLDEDHLPPGYDNILELVGLLTKRLMLAGVGLGMVYMQEDAAHVQLYLGGHVPAEYTRIRVDDTEEIPHLSGPLLLGGIVAAEYSRIRLVSQL